MVPSGDTSKSWKTMKLFDIFVLGVSFVSLFVIIIAEDHVRGVPFPLEPKDVVFVGLSQPNSYHKGRAEVFRRHLKTQFEHLEATEKPVVRLLHEQWPTVGTWTILPIIPSIATLHATKKWLFISDVETRLNVTKLLDKLASYDHEQTLFLGRGLFDRGHTIIHHFNWPDKPFAYPDFAAGFLFSMKLVRELTERLDSGKLKSDFSIDPKYELALYVHDDGKGVTLTDVPFLCTEVQREECSTVYPLKFPDCGDPISEDDMFVAVKTCKQYHKSRVPVVLNTWGKQTTNIEYYSEEADESIPTVDLGVSNEKSGHCAKTYAILANSLKAPHISGKKWLVIADDDTLLSIPRLRSLLACYDPSEAVALGERYGFRVTDGRGYDYLTGGGGMVFSMTAVRQLLKNNNCPCGTPNSPDDMHIGMCLKRLNIPATHSPLFLFHQARHGDYSVGYLSWQRPVSFHKHWNCDPYKEYESWLAADDHVNIGKTSEQSHGEL